MESIPTVSVKMTYNSKIVTRLLGWMQQLGVFNKMSLKARRKTFGGSGDGDTSVFEVIIKTDRETKYILLKSEKGQAELTALSAVLHTEALIYKDTSAGVYFAHQIHDEHQLLKGLQQYNSITVKVL